MVRIIALILGIVAILILGVVCWYYATREDGGVEPPPNVDPASFRNHQHMARILDRVVNDDFISGVIPANIKVEINVLLSEYYGKELREEN